MLGLLSLLIIGIVAIGITSYVISEKSYRAILRKTADSGTSLFISILIFVAVFLLLTLVIGMIILSNMDFGR